MSRALGRAALECRVLTSSDVVGKNHPVYELERQAIYPFGTDRFRIDHGADYLSFFRRMGEVVYFTFFVHGRLAVVAAVVLRDVVRQPGGPPERVAYLGDVKAAAEFRGTGLAHDALGEVGRQIGLRTDMLYGVSMDPAGRPNPVVPVFQRSLGVKRGPRLVLYTFLESELPSVLPILERQSGPLGYACLSGIKDIVLESSGRPMPLVHLQYGPCARAGGELPAHPVFMLSTPEASGLDGALRETGAKPSASATIFHRGMENWDWRFLLTSEI